MRNVIANIVGCDQPVVPDLSLETEVPLVNCGRYPLEGVGKVGARGRKDCVLVDRQRYWIAAWVVRPWIGEIHVVQQHQSSKWLTLRHRAHGIHGLLIGKRSEGRSDRGASTSGRIPSHAEARLETSPPIARYALTRYILGIPRINYARGGVHIPGAVHVLFE